MTGRGNERRPIYRDDRDREHFCELLGEMAGRFRVRIHAYVLMDNHYHLLARTGEPNLSHARWLNVTCAVKFNGAHRCHGTVFQGRFKSVLNTP